MLDIPKSHRELYPEQYTHALIGRYVTVIVNGSSLAEGVVERVILSRYGPLAILADKQNRAFAAKDCHPRA